MNPQPDQKSLPSMSEALGLPNYSLVASQGTSPQMPPQPPSNPRVWLLSDSAEQLLQTQRPPLSQTTHYQPSSPTLLYQAQASSELAHLWEVSTKGEYQEMDFLKHTDLAEIHASSAALQGWSNYYASMERDREQPVNLDMLPSLESVKDMLRHAEKITSAAMNIVREQWLDEMRGKKLLMRAAPFGPCRHCACVESPQWRTGPDGFQTLCNACGIHYAKMRRHGFEALVNHPRDPNHSREFP